MDYGPCAESAAIASAFHNMQATLLWLSKNESISTPWRPASRGSSCALAANHLVTFSQDPPCTSHMQS